MAKYKITEKQIKNNEPYVVGFGYCQIAGITRFCDPAYYTAGIYGWKADYYRLGGVMVGTGYNALDYTYCAGMPNRLQLLARAKKAREIIKKYNSLLDGLTDWHKGREIVAQMERELEDC